MTDILDVPAFRNRMPVTQQWAYFDHAAVAPISGPALATFQEWTDDIAASGDVAWAQWMAKVERVRDTTAKFIGVGRSEIAFIPNTTAGVNLVAESVDWRPGDNVIACANDFPSNVLAWRSLDARGVECRLVPAPDGRLEAADIAARCDERTRLIAMSWVHFASGWRNDLAAVAQIARKHDALYFLDAIQGLGVLPIDVDALGIDFLAADGHKWLLGPEGAGVMYIRRDRLPELRVTNIGWNSIERPGDFSRIDLPLKDAAARYEGGTLNMGGFLALGASIEMLHTIGVDRIAERIDAYTQQLCETLAARGATIVSDRKPEHRSGIVAFDWPGHEPRGVLMALRAAGVAANVRGGHVRLSAHAYNDESDLRRLCDALAAMG